MLRRICTVEPGPKGISGFHKGTSAPPPSAAAPPRLCNRAHEDRQRGASEGLLEEVEKRAHDTELRAAREHRRQASCPAAGKAALESAFVQLPRRTLSILARQRQGVSQRREEEDAKRATKRPGEDERRLWELHLPTLGLAVACGPWRAAPSQTTAPEDHRTNLCARTQQAADGWADGKN
eukprot:CAMPEP_0115453576 /NCGR_PEP_ID=MMETSP0271-20121206/43187_1 /TAXON_ID=71861 /ORGANISM="Scrippsiella trochoidea, Strain CCMP3099" /LENGTH=179 /DNA_ID=CAMNT_0002879951 /DNA_START=453 /DNA_END=991 /DNA_ORIENTATION=+